MNRPQPLPRQLFAVFLASCFLVQQVQAAGGGTLPTAGNYIAGSGSINSSGNVVKVNQSTLRGLIDWNTFSIGAGNRVVFNNGSGVTLNEVTGAQMSSIFGSLSATGSVYLINPQGVLIGNGARINTGGDFLASTLHLDPSTFMNGGALYLNGGQQGFVLNLGNIYSKDGSVFLLADQVTNKGNIQAANGEAGLGAGTEILLKESNGDQRIFVQAPGGDVTNSGRIHAAQAELKAKGGNIYALAGNNGGLIAATGTKTINGQAWIISDDGTTTVASTVKATNSDGDGGHVETSGRMLDISQAKVSTGKGGDWLLDPVDLTIDSSAATAITSALGSGNVTVMTDANTASGPGSTNTVTGNGDINVNAMLSWNISNSLTLSAYRNINVNTNLGGQFNSYGGGNINLIADNTHNGTGAVNINGGTASTFVVNGAYANTNESNVNIWSNPLPASSGANKYLNSPNYWQYYTNNNTNSTGALTSYSYVNNPADLANVNAGTLAIGSGHYQSFSQTVDIDASSLTGFVPIGTANSGSFNGIYDGAQHTISNLTVGAQSNAYGVGLFSAIGSGGGAENLALSASSVTSSSGNGGVLAGSNAGTIKQVAVSGIAIGSSSTNLGGLVGTNTGTIADSAANVGLSGGSTANTGGLVGYNNGAGATIATSYATGYVPAGGGLVGVNNGGSASSSYWDIDTSGQSGSALGGGLTNSQLLVLLCYKQNKFM
jgi:filamentous hemagglutinin family protein